MAGSILQTATSEGIPKEKVVEKVNVILRRFCGERFSLTQEKMELAKTALLTYEGVSVDDADVLICATVLWATICKHTGVEQFSG